MLKRFSKALALLLSISSIVYRPSPALAPFNSDSKSLAFAKQARSSSFSDQPFKRVFFYFPRLRIAEGVTQLRGHFYSRDGRSWDTDAHFSSSLGLADKEFSLRLMYCDVPSYSEMCYLEISPANQSSAWLQTPLTKTVSFWYVLDIVGYERLESGSGWTLPSLTMSEFADCILSQINEESESSLNGYLTYPTLLEPLLSRLSDYSNERANQIKWIDVFSGKETTFATKASAVKAKYEASGKSVNTSGFHWEYVAGGVTVAFALFLFASLAMKRKKKA